MSIYFKNIVGHQKQLKMLEEDLSQGRLAHAYLLAGPADIGKFTLAKALAKAIQTLDMDEDKAFQTAALMDRGVHGDTLIFAKNPEEDSIKIAEIRSIINKLQLSADSNRRILVMEDIDRMTPESANALLKVLEEPPGDVLYIFTSSQPHSLLETILSRVRKIDFNIMTEEELFSSMKNRYRLADETVLKKVAKISFGRIGKAIKLMENLEQLDAYQDVYDQIKSFLAAQDIHAGFSFIGQIYNDPVLTNIFLELAFVALREEMYDALNKGDRSRLEITLERIGKLVKIKALSETNINNRLLLENFILEL
ncbi:DNA polymerase III subunit [Candidatus Peregrinibacteria bacterium]|nr:DNA polymerase III subunit [Candidatus Peregrinibacteria bacterium]